MKFKRREFSQSLLGLLAAASVVAATPAHSHAGLPSPADVKLTRQQRKLYRASLPPLVSQLRQLRRFPLAYSDPPANVFLAPSRVALQPARKP